jgi:NitT/TauT family transport system substrate-binding protein
METTMHRVARAERGWERFTRLAVAGGVALALSAACASGGVAPPSAPKASAPAAAAPAVAPPAAQPAVQPSPAPQPVALKTAYTTTAASMAPLWVAKDAGILAELGLDAELSLIGSGQAMLGALLSGEVPISMAGGNQIAEANLQGGEYLIVASCMPFIPNAVYVHPSIQRPEDLRGKVLGTSNFGSVTHVALRAAFEHWGFEEGRDVTVIRTGGVPEVLAAMQSGATMGGAFSPPQTFQVRDLGYRELLDLATTRYEFASSAASTTRRYLTDRPDVVERYVKALIRGAHTFKTDRDLAVNAIMQYGRIDDRAVAEETWAWYRDKLSDDLVMSPKALENHLRTAAEQNPAALSARPEQFVDNGIVERLKASGYVEQVRQGAPSPRP